MRMVTKKLSIGLLAVALGSAVIGAAGPAMARGGHGGGHHGGGWGHHGGGWGHGWGHRWGLWLWLWWVCPNLRLWRVLPEALHRLRWRHRVQEGLLLRCLPWAGDAGRHGATRISLGRL